MAPPALIIVGSVVIAAGVTFAFHQYVYEPHIAPKLEIMVENWLEKRRAKRRLEAAYREVPSNDDNDDPSTFSDTGNKPVEMDTIASTSKASALSSTIMPLRNRKAKSEGQSYSPVLESPNTLLSFATLNPTVVAAAELMKPPIPRQLQTNLSGSSTPSTMSSSVLNLESLSVTPRSPGPLGSPSLAGSEAGRDTLLDSILAESHLGLSTFSPAPSVTHISPRAINIGLTPTDDDDTPLSDLRQQIRIVYPILSSVSPSEPTSPMGSTVYESFAPTSRGPSPSPRASFASTTIETIRSPFLEPLSTHTAAGSTASWSDVGGSDQEDFEEAEFLVGSDVESWAQMSERAS